MRGWWGFVVLIAFLLFLSTIKGAAADCAPGSCGPFCNTNGICSGNICPEPGFYSGGCFGYMGTFSCQDYYQQCCYGTNPDGTNGIPCEEYLLHCESPKTDMGACCCRADLGQVCQGDACCTPNSPAVTCSGRCGIVTDNCGQSVNCGSSCNDGDSCTTDSCVSNSCQYNPVPPACPPASTVTCGASIPPSNGCGSCSGTGTQCNPRVACDLGGTCVSGSCGPLVCWGYYSPPSSCLSDACHYTDPAAPPFDCSPHDVDCNDNNPCTADSCNAASGCQHTPIYSNPLACGTSTCCNGDSQVCYPSTTCCTPSASCGSCGPPSSISCGSTCSGNNGCGTGCVVTGTYCAVGTCSGGVCVGGGFCGDGIVQAGEQCDQGAGNGACPAACSASCTWNSCPVCGNGVVEAGEQCDTGGLRGSCPATCSLACTTNTCVTCGDGIVQVGEQCDNGVNNGACPRTCSATCTNNACSVCGNGVVEAGEQCDTGALRGACPATCSLACTTNVCATCGDGIVQAGEQCDTGALRGACPATCSLSCTNNVCGFCGDAILQAGESCDLGDASHGNGNGVCPKTCSGTCTTNVCSSCGNAVCDPGENCGTCPSDCSCTGSTTCCGNACYDLQNDNNNCGVCGHVCAGGQTCTLGVCICPSGTALQGGVCREIICNNGVDDDNNGEGDYDGIPPYMPPLPGESHGDSNCPVNLAAIDVPPVVLIGAQFDINCTTNAQVRSIIAGGTGIICSFNSWTNLGGGQYRANFRCSSSVEGTLTAVCQVNPTISYSSAPTLLKDFSSVYATWTGSLLDVGTGAKIITPGFGWADGQPPSSISGGNINIYTRVGAGFHVVHANATGYETTNQPVFINTPTFSQDMLLQPIQCHSDCTYNGVCDFSCVGKNGCMMNSSYSDAENGNITLICQYAKPGVIRTFNSTATVTCCIGPINPLSRFQGPLVLQGCSEHLIPQGNIVSYNGRLVTLTVVTYDKCD